MAGIRTRPCPSTIPSGGTLNGHVATLMIDFRRPTLALSLQQAGVMVWGGKSSPVRQWRRHREPIGQQNPRCDRKIDPGSDKTRLSYQIEIFGPTTMTFNHGTPMLGKDPKLIYCPRLMPLSHFASRKPSDVFFEGHSKTYPMPSADGAPPAQIDNVIRETKSGPSSCQYPLRNLVRFC